MVKRDFADMVIYFCQKVSEMDIAQKYKMELLGMITAIEMRHDKLMPKWIPVTEALPEGKEMVLITNNKGHVRCGQYQGTFDDKNYRWWWKHNTLEEVIAWMPLPEPWRGDR